MEKKVYYRGLAGTCWYNFTEALAYALTYKPTPENVIYTKRIHYGSKKPQYINTYCRKDLADVKKPLLIYVHGGGFVSGITDMRNTYIQNFAKAGYFTASVSYTYAPKKTYKQIIAEVCKAVDFILDSAEKNKLDTGNIVLAGESAGVYFIMYLAALAADKGLASKLGVTFRHNEDFRVRAMVAHCGCVDLKRLLSPDCPQSKFPDMKMMVCSFLGMNYNEARRFLNTDDGALASPHITAGFPPAFFTTCSRDWLRFEGRDMMKEYEALGIDYSHFEGTGIIGNHAWTIVTKFRKGRECFAKTMEFLERYIH